MCFFSFFFLETWSQVLKLNNKERDLSQKKKRREREGERERERERERGVCLLIGNYHQTQETKYYENITETFLLFHQMKRHNALVLDIQTGAY